MSRANCCWGWRCCYSRAPACWRLRNRVGRKKQTKPTWRCRKGLTLNRRLPETLTYYVFVQNMGPGTATNVVVEDTLPEGVEFVGFNQGVASVPTTGTRARHLYFGDLPVFGGFGYMEFQVTPAAEGTLRIPPRSPAMHTRPQRRKQPSQRPDQEVTPTRPTSRWRRARPVRHSWESRSITESP